MQWGAKTGDWDRLATISLLTSGVLVIAGGGLLLYRWRAGSGSGGNTRSLAVGLAADGIRVTF